MIKSCPFCGNKAEVVSEQLEAGAPYFFRVSCGIHYLELWSVTPEEAIAEWNKRYEELPVIENPIKSSKLSFISKGEVAKKEVIEIPKKHLILKSDSCSNCVYSTFSNDCLNCANYAEEYRKMIAVAFSPNVII